MPAALAEKLLGTSEERSFWNSFTKLCGYCPVGVSAYTSRHGGQTIPHGSVRPRMALHRPTSSRTLTSRSRRPECQWDNGPDQHQPPCGVEGEVIRAGHVSRARQEQRGAEASYRRCGKYASVDRPDIPAAVVGGAQRRHRRVAAPVTRRYSRG